jgi:hypothetical protein
LKSNHKEQKMTTLAEIRTKYTNKPKTLAAIDEAIKEHGENAEAVMTRGLPSTKKQSNMWKRADGEGYKTWTYYVGARAGQHANDGYYSVIVKTS